MVQEFEMLKDIDIKGTVVKDLGPGILAGTYTLTFMEPVGSAKDRGRNSHSFERVIKDQVQKEVDTLIKTSPSYSEHVFNTANSAWLDKQINKKRTTDRAHAKGKTEKVKATAYKPSLFAPSATSINY